MISSNVRVMVSVAVPAECDSAPADGPARADYVLPEVTGGRQYAPAPVVPAGSSVRGPAVSYYLLELS